MSKKNLNNIIICIAILLCYGCKNNIDFYNLPAFNADGSVNAVIEIPAGTNTKIEYNPASGKFEIDQLDGRDRIVQYLPYIGNYGFVPNTYSNPQNGGDGDAIDVLIVASSTPSQTVQKVIPIAMLKLIDNNEVDYKIIATPKENYLRIIKATTLKELESNYPEILKNIESWFLNYNPKDKAISLGWENEKKAIEEIGKSLKKIQNSSM